MTKYMLIATVGWYALSGVHAADLRCPLPGKWELDTSVSDEFDADSLDKTKWWDYAPHWPGRPGVYRTLARNVSQREGCLLLTTDKVPDSEIPYEARMDGMQGYTCALVKSRKKVIYGYFEARIKATPAAIRNAFWLYDPLSDDLNRKYSPGDVSEEIDICEILGKHQPGDKNQSYVTSHYTHHYLTPYYEGICNNLNVPLGVMRELAFCPSADYHVYGLLWTKDELVWYVDNVESARMPTGSFAQGGFRRPLHVVLDTEVNDWSGAKVSELDARTLPATAKVDWFRRWVPISK
ncbi:MAG TPA: family 16 glycosylhydrolase [Kiritimatiellia bacterium]|mgnify:FL=1|jgi:beta-glucanase (GH16 family)|nr:family 16 glycosylhydrolase [Kiritimatiellia bacterium]HPW75994.1 family 16 glycosylhydrolase [Kiritimatiellia bacterium]